MQSSPTPWNGAEPNEGNIVQWLTNGMQTMKPMADARWNNSNIDSLFYAGNQSFINRSMQFSPGITSQQFYFNICQNPINMVTGIQRQRRKSIIYNAADGYDTDTTDQYTRLIKTACTIGNIPQAFSKSCELSAVAGLNLMQPYLDYTTDDPAQGSMKVKVWEYNSFMTDAWWREPSMSDSQKIFCQEFISKEDAEARFPDKISQVRPMQGSAQRYNNFYFLPENYNLDRNNLFIVTYAWYKSRKKRKRLYSQKRQQFFDFAGGDGQLEKLLWAIDDLQEVTVDSACWKVCVVLNDQLMYKGENPLWDGPDCPFIPTFWNYDPHLPQFELVSRSLIFPMRSSQFLMNHKIISNNDCATATINSGYKRKSGAVVNEDNLKKAGQGYDIIINEGYDMTDVEKIVPTAIPESDLALANQMKELTFAVTGFDMENWAGQDDKQISYLTQMMKQASNLMIFQKFFDQWDESLKLLGERMLQIALQNWNAEKVGMLLGEEPSPYFYSRVFARYHTIVEEGLDTPTQRNLAAQNKLDINIAFGREVFPPSMIIKDMNIQDKAATMKYLQEQEQQSQQMQQEQAHVTHMFEDAKIKKTYAEAVAAIARAREDNSRSESNLGLYEERLSMIQRNNAMTLKEKQAALTSLLENIQRFGEIETSYSQAKLELDNLRVVGAEAAEKQEVDMREQSNKFMEQVLGSAMQGQANPEQQQPMQQQDQNQLV